MRSTLYFRGKNTMQSLNKIFSNSNNYSKLKIPIVILIIKSVIGLNHCSKGLVCGLYETKNLGMIMCRLPKNIVRFKSRKKY